MPCRGGFDMLDAMSKVINTTHSQLQLFLNVFGTRIVSEMQEQPASGRSSIS